MRRRGNGEGTIYQREDGFWIGQITIGHNGNKPIRRTVSGKTRREVMEKLEELRRQVKDGLDVKPNKITLGEWLDTWLETYAKPKTRRTTWESYESVARVHIKPAIGHILLRNLRPEQVQELYNAKQGKISNTTIRYLHVVLNQALKRAVKNGLVARNVCEAVDKPRQEQKEITPLTQDQVNRLLQAARQDRLFAALLLEWGTGLRRGELLGLRWSDVDLEKGTVTVRRALVRTREGLEFSEPKTKQSRRTVPLPPQVVAELKRHKRRQAEERLALGECYRDNGLVFCRETGEPLDPDGFYKHYKRLLQKAGLPPARLHDMRHTYATTLLELGEHPKVVQELLGHNRITTTLDIYSHVAPGLKERAAQRLAGTLNLGKEASFEGGY